MTNPKNPSDEVTVTLTTGQLLSLVGDMLVCPISDVYSAVELLIGDRFFMTHHLPAIGRFIQRELENDTNAVMVKTTAMAGGYPSFTDESPEERMHICMEFVETVSSYTQPTHKVKYLGDKFESQKESIMSEWMELLEND